MVSLIVILIQSEMIPRCLFLAVLECIFQVNTRRHFWETKQEGNGTFLCPFLSFFLPACPCFWHKQKRERGPSDQPVSEAEYKLYATLKLVFVFLHH